MGIVIKEIKTEERKTMTLAELRSSAEYIDAFAEYIKSGDDTEIMTGFDPNRQMVDILIAQPLIDMIQACKAAGLPVFLSSGYRSYATQQANFERVCYNNGITDGKNAEGNYITMPAGCSEHQTGLCIDITDYYHEIKNDELAQLPTVQWLAEHCADYGFVLTENNLVLEEFVALYGVE